MLLTLFFLENLYNNVNVYFQKIVISDSDSDNSEISG